MSQDRPDLGNLKAGRLYRHSETDLVVEYIGSALMTELDGESVGVFRFADEHGGCLIATRHSYDMGETFQPAGEALADELELGP